MSRLVVSGVHGEIADREESEAAALAIAAVHAKKS
jgi:hypothetical protein